MRSDVRTFARGAGTMLAATLVGSGLLFVLDTWVNGVLGAGDYGLYGWLRRVTNFLGFVVLLGMENAVIRFVAAAETPGAARRAVRVALVATTVVSCAVAATMTALAGPIAASVDPEPSVVTAVRIVAWTLPLASIRMVAVAACQGWKEQLPRALVMYIVWPIAQFAGIALLTRAFGWGLVGAAWAYLAAMGIGTALALVSLARIQPADTGATGPGLGDLVRFSWPMWVQGIVMAAYSWADQVLLGAIRSAIDTGIYLPVTVLSSSLFGVGLQALSGQFAPMIAEKHARGDMDGLQRLYRTSTRWAVAVSIPPIVVCFVAPSVVLHIWPAGSDLAIPALRIACISQLFCTAVGSVNYLLMMAGFPRQPLFNGLPALALNLGLSFALMPRIGVTGAAVANAVSMMTANGLGLWQVWRALKIHPFDAAFVRPFVAAGPAAAAVWLVARIPGPPVVIAACAGVAAAVAFALAMRALGLDEDDRAVVLAIRRRVGR